MAPTAFFQRPIRWLQAISRYRGTTSGGPNFAYDLCIRKITPEQRASLDLSSWDVAFNGAEPVRAETLERFARLFAPCGFRREAFYPCYGLAEATLFATGGLKKAPPVLYTVQRAELERHRVVPASPGEAGAQTLVSNGRPWPGHRVVIVDPESRERCAEGQVGEIWLAGPSIAQGYWQRPAETAATFGGYLATSGEGPFLCTGDLGFVQGGELYVTGRQKDLIIIKGINRYPQEIEQTVERSHGGLRPNAGAAFAVDVGNEERLVVVQEWEGHQRPDEGVVQAVAGAIREAVFAEHEIQVYAVVLIKQGSIPKTSSGKIQRQACRQAYLEGTLDIMGSDTLKLITDDSRPQRGERMADADRRRD